MLWESVGANFVRPNPRKIDIDGLNDNGRTQFAPTNTDEHSSPLQSAGNPGNEKRPDEPSCLSHIGMTIDSEIKKIPEIYENVKIDKYVIMPNHIHMIILIDGFVKTDEQITREIPVVGANCVRPSCSIVKETPTISRIVKQFKGSISKQIGYSIWQKLFHDHIIRNDEEYNKIWQYIDENPVKWHDDCYYDETKPLGEHCSS